MVSFAEARSTAGAVPALAAVSRPLEQAAGCVLAEPVRARLEVPHAATSAMDGWALAVPEDRSPGPGSGGSAGPLWRVRPGGAEGPADLLEPLAPGEAAGVVTGSPVPEGTVSVLRSEHAEASGEELRAAPETPDLEPGRNIRPAGAEARRGDLILEAGRELSAAGAAAAAVAGYDMLRLIPRPRVRLILTGGEVITSGLPGPGQVRDVFGLALPAMLAEAGAEPAESFRIDDDPVAMEQLMTGLRAGTTGTAAGTGGPGEGPDLIITTGGTAASRADTLRPALDRLDAEILVGSVDMRPGHPALLARLPEAAGGGTSGGAYVLGLPGNPLAGFAALTVLGVPLIAALAGREAPPSLWAPAAEDIPPAGGGSRAGAVRLLPARLEEGRLFPMRHSRAHMMRGLASAEVFAVIPAGGLSAGDRAECLEVLGRSEGVRRAGQVRCPEQPHRPPQGSGTVERRA